jgi:hypothetical protein
MNRRGEAATPYLFSNMLRLKWIVRLMWELVLYGWVNRAFGMSLGILGLLGIGLVVVAAKVTAPFIYALF